MGEIGPITFLVLLVCAIFVTGFTAWVFPSQLEASGHGRMPRKFVSIGLFTGGNLLFFLFLIAGVHIVGNPCAVIHSMVVSGIDLKALTDVVCKAQEAGETPKFGPAETQSVFTAFTLFMGLFALRGWRRIEHGALRQLHNVHLVERDIKNLRRHLETCELGLAEVEYDDGATSLHELQKRVNPNVRLQNPESLAVKCQKTSIFLSIWDAQEVWGAHLPNIDQPDVAEIREGNERKQGLARQIDGLVTEVEKGKADLDKLLELFRKLPIDRKIKEETLGAAKADSQEENSAQVENRRSLQDLLTPVVEYFESEYSTLLGKLATATSKSVVLAGDKAGKRLNELKERRFEGLSEIKVIDVHRAVGIGVLVLVGIVLVFWAVLQVFSRFFPGLTPPQGGLIVLLAVSLMFATVLGTMVGGLRSLARSEATPWGWYVLAGLSMTVVHWVTMFIATDFGLIIGRGDAEQTAGPSTAFLLIGGIVPFALVVGLCWLGRRDAVVGFASERVSDGLSLGLILAFAGVMMIVIGETFGVPSPQPDLALEERLVTLPVLTGAIGLLIGASVITSIRTAARSNFIETRSPVARTEDEALPAAAAPAPSTGG